MSREIHLNQVDDAEGAVQAAVAQLEAGQLVLTPDESGWNLMGLASHDSAASQIRNLVANSEASATVAVAHADVIADYVTDPPAMYTKVSARCWPGPVILRIGAEHAEGLARQWPASAQDWALTRSGRAFYCPADPFSRAVLRSISAPALCLVGTGSEPVDASILKKVSLVIRPHEIRFSDPPTLAVVSKGQLKVERPGVVSERMLARLAGEVYLFICTGNTCRSPMAEAMFRKMLSDRIKCREDELMDHGFVVMSAGLAAHSGAAASPEAVELLHEEGIDLSGHESQSVTQDLLFHCDHIFTMTRSHRDAVLSAFPELADQVQLLSSKGDDIPDPIGAGIDEYIRCRDEIANHLEQLLGDINFSRK